MVSQILAQCAFTGGNPATGVTQRNCVVAYSAQGVYTITLGTGIDSTQLDAAVNLTSGANGITWKLADTSDTVKTLTVYSTAGTATTDTFSVSITFRRVSGG